MPKLRELCESDDLDEAMSRNVDDIDFSFLDLSFPSFHTQRPMLGAHRVVFRL